MFAQWIFEKGKFICPERERTVLSVSKYKTFIWMVMMIQWSLFCDNLCFSLQVSAWFMDSIYCFIFFWWWNRNWLRFLSQKQLEIVTVTLQTSEKKTEPASNLNSLILIKFIINFIQKRLFWCCFFMHFHFDCHCHQIPAHYLHTFILYENCDLTNNKDPFLAYFSLLLPLPRYCALSLINGKQNIWTLKYLLLFVMWKNRNKGCVCNLNEWLLLTIAVEYENLSLSDILKDSINLINSLSLLFCKFCVFEIIKKFF